MKTLAAMPAPLEGPVSILVLVDSCEFLINWCL